MGNESQKISVLETLLELVGGKKEIALSKVSTFVKENKNIITLSEALDFLEANEITVIGKVKKNVPQIPYDDPVFLYLRDMGKVKMLDKEEEIKTAFQMRNALKNLQSLITTNLISIQKLILILRKMLEDQSSFDDFIDIGKERWRTEDKRIDVIILVQRINETYKTIIRTYQALSSCPNEPQLLRKKEKLFELIDNDLAKLGLPFKIIEKINPVYEKIITKYENALKTIKEITNFLGIPKEEIEELERKYSSGKITLSHAAGKLGVKQAELYAQLRAFKHSIRVLDKLDRATNPRYTVEKMIKTIKKHQKYKEEYDKAKTALIEGNVRFVINVAKNHVGQGIDFLDLIQEGNHALIKAVEKFDPTKGYKLSTYAIWWIRQAMRRVISTQSKIMNFPPHKMKELKTYLAVSRELTHKLGREPTIKELSDRVGASERRIRSTLDLAFSQISLDQTISETDERTYYDTIINDSIPSPIEIISKKVLFRELREILKELSPKEERVLTLRFGLEDNYPRTLEEIGEIFNLSRERIRQIEEKALQKLRKSKRARILRAYLKTFEEEKG